MRHPGKLSGLRATWVLLVGLAAGFPIGPGCSGPAGSAESVTDGEAAAFAASVEGAADRDNVAAFNLLIDWDSLVAKATEGGQAPEAFREGFQNAFGKTLLKADGLTGQVVANVRQGGSYRLLRLRVRDGRKSALFRLKLGDDDGVNYHEYLLARGPDGRILATDLYLFFGGELLSETLRRSYLQGAMAAAPGVLARLTGASPEAGKGLLMAKEMREHLQAGRGREALGVYQRLPSSLQRDKTFLLLRVQAADRIDERAYLEAFERFRALYPHDACVEYLGIGGFTRMKRYNEALAATDRLDRAVGGDPFLNSFRADILLAADRPEEALRAARAGVAGAPGLIDCHWSLVAADLARSDYPAVLEDLKMIDRLFAPDFDDLTAEPIYAGFLKSPQYDAWTSYLGAKEARQGETPEGDEGEIE